MPHVDADIISCRLCSADALFSFRREVLGRHPVAYYLCPACGLLQSESPYWLDEAYGEALAAADTGVMQRNLWLMKATAVLLRVLGMQGRRGLDYGGGHGVLTRLLRDHGFDFQCWDAHAKNLFARGFDGDPGASYDVVTAFEVIEHLAEPRAFFEGALGRMKPELLLVSSELLCEPVDPDWHYFYFATGQHIAFYQHKTLLHIARSHGYSCISCGSLHLFMRVPRRMAAIRLALRFAPRIYPLLGFSSLTAEDHRRLMRERGLQGDD